jgi:hypothetical protein
MVKGFPVRVDSNAAKLNLSVGMASSTRGEHSASDPIRQETLWPHRCSLRMVAMIVSQRSCVSTGHTLTMSIATKRFASGTVG